MEDGEGDIHFPDSSSATESGTGVLEEDSRFGGVSMLPRVTALVATEDDITVCGRVETEPGVFFKSFTRASTESSDLEAWDFIRDPETSADSCDCREACFVARGVCDSTRAEGVEGVSCPCCSGIAAAETLRGKVNGRVSGRSSACVGRNALISYRSLAVVRGWEWKVGGSVQWGVSWGLGWASRAVWSV